MRRALSFITVACLVVPHIAAADSGAKSLLAVVPDEKSPIQGKSMGAPFYIHRMPTSNTSLKSIFPDLEVFVLKSNGRVAGVGSKRAYETPERCSKSETEVRKLLSKAFPSTYSGPDPRWQYQSSDGAITAGALCSKYVGNPYPELRMDITHTATNNEVLKHFERVPANQSPKPTQ